MTYVVLPSRVARERDADANKMFLVTCSYFEIYNEVMHRNMHQIQYEIYQCASRIKNTGIIPPRDLASALKSGEKASVVWPRDVNKRIQLTLQGMIIGAYITIIGCKH